MQQNSSNEKALDEKELEKAAYRYGWRIRFGDG